MERLRQLWLEAQNWVGGLSRREQVLLGVAAATVAAFAVFVTVFSLANAADATRRRTAAKIEQLTQAQGLAQSYAEAERARKADEAQLSATGVSLITFLEEKGAQSGLDIPTLTPKADVPLGDGRITENSVELTLTDVTLPRLVAFLSAVENGPGMVRVKSLRIEPHPKDNLLTAWATVATYRLKATP
jgi:general secretion pathway protein M